MVTLLLLALAAAPNGGGSTSGGDDDTPRGGSCDCDGASADGDPQAAVILGVGMLAFLKRKRK